jgi:hypothetical protein
LVSCSPVRTLNNINARITPGRDKSHNLYAGQRQEP